MTDDSNDSDNSEDGSNNDPPYGTTSIGQYGGHRVFLSVSGNPDGAPAPEHFGVDIWIPDADGSQVHIVRIDTYAAVDIHIDRLYLPEGEPNRKHDPDIDSDAAIRSVDEAVDWLLEDDRWWVFISRYADVHGLPERATD